MRSSWDQTFMHMAVLVGQRSRCEKTQVGCIITSDDNAYVCMGYNGPPSGMRDPESVRKVLAAGMPIQSATPLGPDTTCSRFCERMMTGDTGPDYSSCPSIHAEVNALLHADHTMIQGGTLYVNSTPCVNCTDIISNSGIARVVMLDNRSYRPAAPIIARFATNMVYAYAISM